MFGGNGKQPNCFEPTPRLAECQNYGARGALARHRIFGCHTLAEVASVPVASFVRRERDQVLKDSASKLGWMHCDKLRRVRQDRLERDHFPTPLSRTYSVQARKKHRAFPLSACFAYLIW